MSERYLAAAQELGVLLEGSKFESIPERDFSVQTRVEVLSVAKDDQQAEAIINGNEKLSETQKKILLGLRTCIKFYFALPENERSLPNSVIDAIARLGIWDEVIVSSDDSHLAGPSLSELMDDELMVRAGRSYKTNPVQPPQTRVTSLHHRSDLGLRTSDKE